MFCDATATDDLKLINEGGSEPRVMVSTAAFHAFERRDVKHYTLFLYFVST